MNRLLFLAAIIAAVYLLLNSYRNRVTGGKPREQGEESIQAENMVRCAHCGVHLPKSESVSAGSEFYCGDAHRRAHQQPPENRDVGK